MAIAMQLEENPAVFEQEFVVTEAMIDRNNHLNNVVCVQWIQDISVNHSNSTGGTDLMEALGCGWMIHTQHVEYKAQAFLGEKIKGITWVPEYSKISTNRHCKFIRESDGKEIFSSVTTWVLVDMKRGRPVAIPEELKDKFRRKP